MCIKALLQKTSLIALTMGFALSPLSAEDNNLLLKKAVIKLYKDNQALEKRIELLEDKLGIKRAEQNASIKVPKNVEENSFVFLQRAKNEFAKGKKIIPAKAIESAKYYSKPNKASAVVGSIQKGANLYVKGIEESYGNVWYKIEDGMFVEASVISFRSKK
ncbi:hypothetical protein [Campylobacter helveticus]|uniref:hypothetical protein n=1 Tax=Campylobacter helveticus TaxID=28898 RepID=UPI00214B4A54|nr:hypothetical protein [Campylobacter helveticus]MCR2059786.1 hypothetical protein [Campylobacter helveticus]